MLSPASDTPLKASSKASLVEGLARMAPELDVGGLEELAGGGACCSVAQSCSMTASTLLPSLYGTAHTDSHNLHQLKRGPGTVSSRRRIVGSQGATRSCQREALDRRGNKQTAGRRRNAHSASRSAVPATPSPTTFGRLKTQRSEQTTLLVHRKVLGVFARAGGHE